MSGIDQNNPKLYTPVPKGCEVSGEGYVMRDRVTHWVDGRPHEVEYVWELKLREVNGGPWTSTKN